MRKTLNPKKGRLLYWKQEGGLNYVGTAHVVLRVNAMSESELRKIIGSYGLFDPNTVIHENNRNPEEFTKDFSEFFAGNIESNLAKTPFLYKHDKDTYCVFLDNNGKMHLADEQYVTDIEKFVGSGDWHLTTKGLLRYGGKAVVCPVGRSTDTLEGFKLVLEDGGN